MVNRKRIQIEALKNSNGDWITEDEQLSRHAIDHFRGLFTEESVSPNLGLPNYFSLEAISDFQTLVRPASSEEVRSALFAIGPYKAPGPDDFPVIFFQAHWTVVEPSIMEFVRSVIDKGMSVSNDRINGWIAQTLSMAGRNTLAKSVIQAIPSFTMQVMRPPANPLARGGLGLQDLNLFNDALLAKLGWGVITNPSALWVRVLKGKYINRLEPSIQLKICSSNSWQWRGIARAWNRAPAGAAWTVRNGQCVMFWEDRWVTGCGPLLQHIIRTLDEAILNRKVAEFAQPSGSWNWGLIQDLLDSTNMLRVAAQRPPSLDR
ncbi:hypothetical protein CRG98_039680 [Punica granatum]|uniref:Reverse transcriptase zinc-binding domain-containing protein n=1 Tax=Punica granatum TaxID=22663 RepID=A0A2I0I7G8_PUNGR|nr:hypothetical protein CRG98_039680 [Punica granatum]